MVNVVMRIYSSLVHHPIVTFGCLQWVYDEHMMLFVTCNTYLFPLQPLIFLRVCKGVP